MTERVRVGIPVIAVLAICVVAVRAQVPAAAQAKPADLKAEAPKEEMPADFTAFNNAGKEKDLQKRVEAYEKFLADHPDSALAATARNQIQSTLLAILKSAQPKLLEAVQAQVEAAKKDASPSALSSTYSRLATSLLSADLMLDRAEEYGRAALSSMDEQKYVQERKEQAQRIAESFATQAANPPPAAPTATVPPATPAPAPPNFTLTIVDGVPFAKLAPPRPAAAATAKPAATPTAPRAPTDDELRASFRAERASVQATLGQILVKRDKNAEGEALLKEAYAARPAAALMATISRILAGSAKKAGDDRGQLEYLSALALSGRITKEEQQDFEAVYRSTHNGSLEGIEEMLDERFARTAPKVEVERSPRKVTATDRAVLVEMFTGSG